MIVLLKISQILQMFGIMKMNGSCFLSFFPQVKLMTDFKCLFRIHGLCDCCSSYKRCCYACFCCPCFAGSLFKRAGECACQCCVPGSIMALRGKLRTGFRIKGSMCKDCCASNICCLCVMIQMDSELDDQEI